jgi:pyrimidine operon attenuation protein/uracil phosphoribosyltransferase
MAPESLILNKKQLLQKIKRIAFEIYEQNYKEQEIVLAGIDTNGYTFARFLKTELESISSLKAILVRITLDKLSLVQSDIELDTDPESLKNKTIVLTDDVLNTGRVLAYALKPFLNMESGKLQTAVIVDRRHQLFPIVADYVGYSLATTIKEHIEVSFEGNRFGVYLH